MLDVIAMVLGLVNGLSTWRVVLAFAISGSVALLLFFRLSDRFEAILSAGVVIIAGLTIGLSWQIRFERSRGR